MRIHEILNESGLSRVYRQTRDHDYGTITAFRYAPQCGTGEPYTHAQNMQRNRSLLAKIRAAGYGATAIKGSYIEDSGNLKRDLMRWGEEFEQDSIIYGEAGGVGVLIGTNHCPGGYPGYGKEVAQGGAIFGKTGEFMSRVQGRPFVFAEGAETTTYGVARYPTELRGLVAEARKHWSEL